MKFKRIYQFNYKQSLLCKNRNEAAMYKSICDAIFFEVKSRWGLTAKELLRVEREVEQSLKKNHGIDDSNKKTGSKPAAK